MISVVIPAYNEENVLPDSLSRLFAYLSKRSTSFEVIAVDNGSTDQTERVSRELEKKYSWFRYFRIPERSVGRAFAK